MGFFSEFIDACKEFHEGLCDIAEYATIGFVEEVVKGNGEYKTSYEKRNEADAIYAASESRLNNASKSLNRTLEALNEKIRLINDRKRVLLSGMKDISEMACGLPTDCYMSSVSDPFYGLGGQRDIISACIRVSLADDYLEDAHDYRTECNEKIARINNFKARLSAVETVLDEESRLLDILERSYEIRRFAKGAEIAEKLRQLLIRYICNTDGELDSGYIQSVNSLKELCGEL